MENLNRMPRGRDVVLEQIRIVGLGLRNTALVAVAGFTILTIKIAIDAVGGRAETWFDSAEPFPLAFIAFLYALGVWYRDRLFAPAFLWTLPVDRRRLALAKVFAGWVWLLVILTTFVVWQRVLAVLSGVPGAEIVPLFAFIEVTAAYLFGSALAVGLRHPMLWLFGALGVAFLTAYFNQRLDVALNRMDGLLSVLAAAQNARPLVAFLWLGCGLAALWAAVSRHRESRRH